MLLGDSSNAFNSIDRQNALQNILNLCPALATNVINCYCINVPLLIDGDVILSAEGTTQRDPLAMVLYVIGILPHLRHFHRKDCSQMWYGDDAATCETV